MMGTLGIVKDAAIGWVVQGILGSLFTETMEAWWREADVAGDVENLKSEMLSTNTVVGAARGRKIENEGLLRSLFHLKQLLYDAEDVMDELDYHRLQREIEGGNCDGSAGGTHPLGDRASSSAWSSALQKTLNAVKQIPDWALVKHRKRKREDDTLLALESKHDTISQRINKIVTQLRTAREDVRRVLKLESSRPITMPYQSQSEPRSTRLTTSMQVEKKVYGREAERNRVVELLTNGKYSDLHVLPIVGGGGVGKTTLARFVCNDQRIGNHFDLQMWVCVSTIFDQVRLTREMLEHVCKDGRDYGKINSLNVLQDTLLKNIRNKRFLLVLDDIWEDKDKNGWATLLAPLKRNEIPGCMILATTRSKSVAKMIGTMDAVEMKGLDEKEFWLLFKACAFGNENCTDHPSLHTIGQQIAKTLKGYPLAAQSVGALLKENLSHDHWRDVQETWKSRQENDGDILPILELSYDYLPSHLQHCFSYCSLFPEDHRFYGETLVYAWISQNFVQCDDTSKRLEEIGMRYLDRLVDLGFFQKVDSQDLGFFQKVDSHYVMHDLMHELAEKVSSNECANINGLQSKKIQPCIRHLSIITTAYDKDEHGSFPSENFEKILQDIKPLQKLRTLMFFGRSSVNLLRTRSFQILCKDAKSLRLLRIYVTGADIDSVLNFVKPYHLRWLEFIFVCPNNEDIAFPEALTKFYHLQVLDFSRDMAYGAGLTKKQHLEKLHLFWNRTVTRDMCSEFSRDTETEEESSPMDDSGPTSEPSRNTEREVLEGLEPYQNLKYLRISGYDGATSPAWLANSLTSLQTLHLEYCGKLQIIPSLQRLPFLRKFELRRMLNVTEVSIPSLEELVLDEMPKLESCSCTSLRDLNSSLRVLKVTGCPVLKVFPLFEDCQKFKIEQKSWLSSLDELIIRKCPRLLVPHPLPPSTSVSKLSISDVSTLPSIEGSSSGTLRIGRSSDKLRMLDGKMLSFHNLRFLTHLTIADCRDLTYISFEVLRQLISLKILEINHCGKLFSSHVLPEDTHEDMAAANCNALPSLECLHIRDCGIAGKWLSLMLRHVQALQELSLEDCEEITAWLSVEEEENSLSNLISSPDYSSSTSSVTDGLLCIPLNLISSLKKISIVRCWYLTYYGSKDVFAGFTSLEELAIWGCPKLLSSLVHKDGNDDQANGRWLLPQSLVKLKISFEFSPETVRSFVPQKLEIICSPETLQPCFPGNLTCLKILQVSWIPSLKSLQLHSCTALEKLAIRDCTWLAALEGWQSLGNLKALEVYLNPSLKSLQLYSCTTLQELTISNCKSLNSLEGLQSLGNLKALRVYANLSLKSLQLHSCTALEELEIGDCESLTALEGSQSLGGLRRLMVYGCPGLSLSRQGNELCPRLETLEIDCPSLTTSFCKHLTSLLSLRLCFPIDSRDVMSRLTDEQEEALQLLTSLQELTFWGFEVEDLIDLPAGLHSLRSLKKLQIFDCPGISRLPEKGLPPSLEQLDISACSKELNEHCRMFATSKLKVKINGKYVN